VSARLLPIPISVDTEAHKNPPLSVVTDGPGTVVTFGGSAPSAPIVSTKARARDRWSGSAYLFVRPGEGAPTLAAGGTLGGSQVAGRVTYRLNPSNAVRTTFAARFYAPVRGKGAEGALGLDWHPVAGVPLRIAAERRVGLDRFGRDAWSAYAAGGFYREPLPRMIVDGYAQGGVVGARRRDLFADGGLRAGYRYSVGGGALTTGAGIWAAAQPDAERVDIGPRVALAMPVAGQTFGVAVEGRVRIAGDARPGSGAALTVGVDF
jgi:hypothetical protein